MVLEKASIPFVDIDGVPTPRLILGHLPFLGESYQGEEKNKEYSRKFSRVENTVKVIAKAVSDYGVKAMAATSPGDSGLSKLLLEAVKRVIKITQTEVSLIPCFRIPLTINGKAVNDYRRWVTYHEFERRIVGQGLTRKYILDPILLCRRGWVRRFSEALRQSSSYSEEEVESLRINYSGFKEALASLKKFRIMLVEAGSESDFLAMTGRLDLIKEFTQFLKRKFSCPILLGLHHAGTSIPILEERCMEVAGYVTPINSLGALMLPSKSRALKAIKASEKPVIAIKPLAGGRIPPEEAFKYLFQRVGVDISMVGVASEEEVDEDFQEALKAMN